MAEQRQFDDLGAAANNQANTTDDENAKTRQVQEHSNGLQGIIRVISILPCFPPYQPRPDTPNIDKLKELHQRFKGQDPTKIDVDLVERSKVTDLCEWTQKVLTYLPNINDAPESDEQTKQVVTHFNTIKKFYNVAQTAGVESQELDTFFNAVQIYESVMSVAFVMFDEHPETLKEITTNVNSAIQQCEGHSQQGCISLILCGAALLSKFNAILGILDQKIGEFGIVRVAEFIAGIIEVFSKYFNLDLKDTEKLTALSDSIQEMIRGVSNALRSVFGDSIPSSERKKKWAPLDITEKIRSKLSKFEKESPIVGRTVSSFENFFSAVEKIDDNFQDLGKVKTKAQQSSAPGDDENNNNNEEQYEVGDDDDIRKVELNPLAAQIANNQLTAVEEVRGMAKIFQNFETILSYGILIFKNEDEVLNPLLDHVDECTKILQKFIGLHPLYKVLLGTNYLSKIKVIIKKIVKLLEDSNLKVNSPKEFLAELRQKYPDLLYLLCESFLNDNLKKKLVNLPDPLENILNNALDGALSKFKNKIKF